MIDKKYYNNTTVFAIKRNDDKCFYLQLTPENYEKEFIRFVREARLTRQEIYELKTKIQIQLFENVKSKLKEYREQQERIKKQQAQWLNKKRAQNLRTQSSSIDEISNVQNRMNNKVENLNSVQSQNNLLRSQQIEKMFKRSASFGEHTKQQIGIQTADIVENFHINLQASGKSSSFSNMQTKNQKVQQHQQQLQLPVMNIKNDQNQQNQMMSSPRFNYIHSQHQIAAQTGNQKRNSEEDIVPRESPIMASPNNNSSSKYQSNYKSTQVNSPETKKKIVQQKIYYTEGTQIHLNSSNKRIFFLQNYQKLQEENNQSIRDRQFELSFQLRPKTKSNPFIFQRLYQEQTTSFKNKNMQEINTSEQKAFNEIINQLSKKKQPMITKFQNMSTKTTKSFRSKFQPQPNVRQINEEKDYQRQFILHLQRKQQQRRKKQILSKQKQGKKSEERKFIPKGSHCQAKLLRERITKQKKDTKEKQKKIRQRIKSQHLNYQSCQDQSCSPASKNKNSRVCQCCSPSKPKQQSNLTKNKKSPTKRMMPMLEIKGNKNSSNKKYVSNVLNQSFKEFEKQIKQFKL